MDLARADAVERRVSSRIPTLSYGNVSKLSGANTIDGTQPPGHPRHAAAPAGPARRARGGGRQGTSTPRSEDADSRYAELALRTRELFIEVLTARETARSLTETQSELDRASRDRQRPRSSPGSRAATTW